MCCENKSSHVSQRRSFMHFNINLKQLFLFIFRLHTFQVNLLAVNPAFQYWPIAGNPAIAFVSEGKNVVAVVISHTAKEVLVIVIAIIHTLDNIFKVYVREA